MVASKTIKFFLLCATVITIVLSRLNLNSICIVLLTATWLAEGDYKNKLNLLRKDKLFIAYVLYLVLQIAGTTLSDDIKVGWKEIESKLGFLAIPLIFCSESFTDINLRRRLMFVFSISLTLAAGYCLGAAALRYFVSSDETVFFYHQLVSPLDHHAVYFAVFTFISLVFLMREGKDHPLLKKNKIGYITWIVFYLFLLFLLSSKLVLFITVAYILYSLIASVQSAKAKIWRPVIAGLSILLIITVISFTNNPVKKRFVDLKGDIELLSLNKYTDNMYFNGWQLRLLLWRFTFEIIRDKNAWLTGVGPTNDQQALEKKYLDMGLYSGLESRGDRGYLEFNCHNQFLQSSLQCGIPGLLVFLIWCVIVLYNVIRKREPVLTWMSIIIFAFCLTESVFERQYGMVLTTLFPLLYLYSNKPVRHKSQ